MRTLFKASDLIECLVKRAFVFIVFILAGCASTSIHNPFNDTGQTDKELRWCVKNTSEMNIVDKTVSEEANKNAFEQRVKIAVEDIENYVNTKIKSTENFTVSKINKCKIEEKTSPAAKNLYLQIDLSGYGSLKNKWKRVLIGTGIVEGIVQGIVAGSATQNAWLGLGVAAEEMTSEYLTWNGVDWLLGETYAPVTLEGKLTYQGNVIWKDSYFVIKNDDELSKDAKEDKSKQLLASLHKAEHKLLGSADEYIQAEVIGRSK